MSFSATAVAVRALARTLALFEILALRNAAGIAILVALALPQPALRASFRPRRFVLHLTRNLIHFGATYAWALGVTLLAARDRVRARVHGAGLGRRCSRCCSCASA